MLTVSEEESKLKPGEIRKVHPFETRLKARNLYLRNGFSLRKVALETKIPLNTIVVWAKTGHWRTERQRLERHLARKELKRIATEAALELRNTGRLLNNAQDILETQFYKQALDETGAPIQDSFILKGRGDWKLRDEAVMQFLLMLTQRRESHLKTTLDFLGDYFPKVAPEKLKLPVAGRAEEAIAEVEAEKTEEIPEEERGETE